MTVARTSILVHLVGVGLASALAAYWVLRLIAPAPLVVPAVGPAPAFRDPDPGLAARLMGDVGSGPAASALNVQVSGVFAAAKDSSAVIAVDGRPPRAVLLGRDVAPGYRLVEIRPEGVTLEHAGLRTTYPVPAPTVAKATSAAPMFSREGDTLTAPRQEPAAPAKAAADASRFAATSAPGVPPPIAPPAGASIGANAPGVAPAGMPASTPPEEPAAPAGRIGRSH